MRFPSIRMVASDARRSFARWPAVLLAAGMAAVSAIVLVEAPHDPEHRIVRWIVTATLALPLLFALTLTGERLPAPAGRALPLLGVPILAGIFVVWPEWTEEVASRRYVQLSLVFHLLAAWLPLAGSPHVNAFWQYNRRVFLRFLLGALYTLVLFLGAAGALAALDRLFGLDVDGDLYADLFILLGFVFHTWFFVGGVPAGLDALESDRTYPTPLKVLSQFILLPIVVVYLAILTAYLGKVAITQEWPSGWIGYLVTSVAGVGILSLLLVHPVRDRAENRWVATYARWFYVALLPSIVMLVLAVWKRIDQYGVTENRYFLLVLSAWLAFVAVTFAARRRTSITLIPLSLMVVAALTCFGPWSAYAVSERSQRGRLTELLARNALLDGRVVRVASAPPPAADVQEISRVLEYLVATHGADAVTDRFDWPEAEPSPEGPAEPMTEAQLTAGALMARAGLDFVRPGPPGGEPGFGFHAVEPVPAVSLDGWALGRARRPAAAAVRHRRGGPAAGAGRGGARRPADRGQRGARRVRPHAAPRRGGAAPGGRGVDLSVAPAAARHRRAARRRAGIPRRARGERHDRGGRRPGGDARGHAPSRAVWCRRIILATGPLGDRHTYRKSLECARGCLRSLSERPARATQFSHRRPQTITLRHP